MTIQVRRQQPQRKRVKHAGDYYKNLSKKLALQGPVKVELADTTKINMSGVWKKLKL